VATPGRLLDFLATRTTNVRRVSYLVPGIGACSWVSLILHVLTVSRTDDYVLQYYPQQVHSLP